MQYVKYYIKITGFYLNMFKNVIYCCDIVDNVIIPDFNAT